MNTLSLYTYFRSSASFRVRIALNLKGLEYEHIGVHLLRDGGQQLLAPYREINADGVVPSLVDSTIAPEALLTQSLAIIEYIDECYPAPPLLPQTPAERAFVRSVALQIACEIHPLNNLRVLKYLKHTLGITEEQKTEWYAHWIRAGFASLEKKLAGDTRVGSCVCGDAPSLADLCLVPQIWNARRFNIPMDAFPTLCRLYKHTSSLPAFAKADPAVQPDADTPAP